MITTDPRVLRGQMQAYAACEDPDVREVAQRWFGRLVEHVEGLGVTPEQVAAFFARGMLSTCSPRWTADPGLGPVGRPDAGDVQAQGLTLFFSSQLSNQSLLISWSLR